jgi:hypothetical protein
MANDFSSKQIRVSQLIASGGIAGTTAGLLIYSASDGTSYDGGFNPDIASGFGSDVFLFVSGSKHSLSGSARNNVALFGGDVVISGTLYAERQVIEVDETVDGTLMVSGSAVISNELTIKGTSQLPGTTVDAAIILNAGPESAIVWDTSPAPVPDASIYESSQTLHLSGSKAISLQSGPTASTYGHIYITGSTDNGDGYVWINPGGEDINFAVYTDGGAKFQVDAGTDTVYAKTYNGGTGDIFKVQQWWTYTYDLFNVTTSETVINEDGLSTHDFRVETNNKTHAVFADAGTDQVLILSGGAGVSPNEAAGTDVVFYVSGSSGGKDQTTRGISLFGGDLVVSGVLYGTTSDGARTRNTLIVGSDLQLAGTGSAGEDRYLTFGPMSGSLGYGIRFSDDDSRMQFKDHGGTWMNLSDDFSGFTDGGHKLVTTSSLSIDPNGTYADSKAGDVFFYVSGDSGHSVFGADVISSGSFKGQLSGSHTELSDGRSFIAEGSGISVSSGSDGQIMIAYAGLADAGGGWTDDGTDVRLTTIGDNVGVGIYDAVAKLHVSSSQSSDDLLIVGGTVAVNGVQPTLLVKPGLVGINKDSPGNNLHIGPHTATPLTASMKIETANAGEAFIELTNVTGDTGSIKFTNISHLEINNTSPNKDIIMSVNDAGITKSPFFIKGTSGHVGIGTDSPAYILTSKDTSHQLKLENNTGGFAGFNVDSNDDLSINISGDDFIVWSNSDTGIWLQSSAAGNCTIKLDTDDDDTPEWMIGGSGSTFYIASGSRQVDTLFRIDPATDRIGIGAGSGAAAPQGTLHVDQGPGDTSIIIEKDGSNTGALRFYTAAAETAAIYQTNLEHLFINNYSYNDDIVFGVNDGGVQTNVMQVDGAESALKLIGANKLMFNDTSTYIRDDGVDLSIHRDGDIALSASNGDIVLDAAGSQIYFNKNGTEAVKFDLDASPEVTFTGNAKIQSDGNITLDAGTDGTGVGYLKENGVTAAYWTSAYFKAGQEFFLLDYAVDSAPPSARINASTGLISAFSSQKKHKINITPNDPQDLLARILKLRPVSYNRKESLDRLEYGLIADEVQEAIGKEYTHQGPDYKFTETNQNVWEESTPDPDQLDSQPQRQRVLESDETVPIDWMEKSVVAALVGAVQLLNSEIESLKARVAELEL